MKFSKVLLKESADPNASPPHPLGSQLLKGQYTEKDHEGNDVHKGYALELDPTGCWVIVDGLYMIPREMVRHGVIEKEKAKR